MHPRFGALAALLLAAAAALHAGAQPAAAQVRLRAGQTVTGTITDDDQTLTDKSKFDAYTYQGRRGEELTITMRSSDFDTYLYIGRMTGDRWNLLTSDDDGGGGTNSRIHVVLPEDAEYVIRANAFEADARGTYEIAIRSSLGSDTRAEPARAAGAEPPPVPIRMGQTLRGSLAAGDPTAEDGSYYDAYTFTGRRGDRVRIVMRSDDFDTYLYVGRVISGRWHLITSDDDGAGGTDSEIEIVLPEDAEYQIRANSLSGGATGDYTLQLGTVTDPARRTTGGPAAPTSLSSAGRRT